MNYLNIKKHPHFSEAKKLDSLRPKQFCELTGLPPNYATLLKKYSVYDTDGKRLKVRATIDNIILCNGFKKYNWAEIKSNFSTNKVPKKEKSKNPVVKSKKEIVQVTEPPTNESDFPLADYWRDVLSRILDVSETEQAVGSLMLDGINKNLGIYQNPQNLKYITEAYQKLQNIQKERNDLIHKDIVVFMVGTISEFMLMSCNSLMRKQLTEYNATSEEIDSLDNKFMDLVEFAQKEITQLIGDKIAETRD